MIEAVMLWNEPNNKSHWDFEVDSDWSLYAAMVDEWPEKVASVRAVTRLPVWVSEVGVSTFGAEEVQEFGLCRTAELLRNRVPRIHWYSLYDLPRAWPATTRHREAEGSAYYRHFYMGLLREDGAPKRALEHFAALTPELGICQWFHFVLAPAYEGGHPDHDAAAFAAASAVALARRSAPGLVLQLVEYPLYHAGPDGPWQQGFLPGSGPVLDVPLGAELQAMKRRMLDCFASQRHVLEQFPCDRERFRRAPARDFTRPPHGGPLQYEAFPWGMTGERFRALAALALRELGLAPREAAWR